MWLRDRHLLPRIMCKLCATSFFVKYDEAKWIFLKGMKVGKMSETNFLSCRYQLAHRGFFPCLHSLI